MDYTLCIVNLMATVTIVVAVRSLRKEVNYIMSTQAELAVILTELTAQVAKIGTETTATLQKVVDLEAALAAAGNVTPEVQAALDALKAQAQAVDDLVPDAPVVEPPVEPPVETPVEPPVEEPPVTE